MQLTKKEIVQKVLQSNCKWKPDTVYRRVRKGLTLEEAMTAVIGVTGGRRFYVYALLDSDRIFYVGSGTGDRAWRHWVKPYVDYQTPVAKYVRNLLATGIEPSVQILKENLTKLEARELEIQKIRELKPACNWIGSIKYNLWGREFASLKEVAEDSRCKCSHVLLRSRVCCSKWPLWKAVLPKTTRGRRTKPTQGPDGKFCRI